MKNKRNFSKNISLYVMIIFMVIILAGIVIFNLFFQSENDWKTIGANLITSLLSAITVGLIVGTFTKIISDNFFKIEKNDRWLKSFGIEKIGNGISTPKDTLELFGNHFTKKYPREVKLFFITGNVYLDLFKNQIASYLAAPDTILKILLIDYSDENAQTLKRMEELCPQSNTYKEQILNQTLPNLKEIIKTAKCDPNKIQLRFFKDEYRYNFRIAKYVNDNTINTKCWLNIQPFNKSAADLSIMLHGSSSNENINNQNIVAFLDDSFDYLFNKYENTQYDFSH